MAQRIEIFKVTCGPNVAQSAAQETELSFAQGVVRALEIVIPAGHAGLTGLAIAQAHQVIIPASGDDWIVGDNEPIKWPLDNYLDADTWSAFAYNTDAVYPHSWYLRFLIDEIQAPNPATGNKVLAVSDIYAAAGQSA